MSDSKKKKDKKSLLPPEQEQNLRRLEDEADEALRRMRRVKSELDAALSSADEAIAEARRARQAKHGHTVPAEPAPGSIIKYSVQFDKEGTVFQYVAYRAPNGGLWYRTGHTTGWRWDEIVRHMMLDVTAQRLGIEFFLLTGSGRWVSERKEDLVEAARTYQV